MTSEWFKRAACRDSDPESFFPLGDPDGSNLDTWNAAKAFCTMRCSVSRDCREYAIKNRLEHGVWGGTDPRQRDRIRRNRYRQAGLLRATEGAA